VLHTTSHLQNTPSSPSSQGLITQAEINRAMRLSLTSNDLVVVKGYVGPDLATALLGNNPINRRVAKANLEKMVRIITSGEWKMNGDTIRFTSTGILLDGQHRLMAIEKTGIPVETLLLFGVAEEANLTIDTGKGRSNTDALIMQGFRANSAHSATINLILLYKEGYNLMEHPNGKSRPSSSRSGAAEFASAHWDDLHDAVKMGARLKSMLRLNRAWLAMAVYVCAEVDAELAFNLAEAIMDARTSGKPGDPVAILFRRYMGHSGGRHPLPYEQQAAFFIRVFNALRDGESIQRLVAPTEFPRA